MFKMSTRFTVRNAMHSEYFRRLRKSGASHLTTAALFSLGMVFGFEL